MLARRPCNRDSPELKKCEAVSVDINFITIDAKMVVANANSGGTRKITDLGTMASVSFVLCRCQ